MLGVLTMRADGSHVLVGHNADFLVELLEEARFEAASEDPRALGVAVVEIDRGSVHVHAVYEPASVRAVRLFAEALETLLHDNKTAAKAA